MGQTNQSLSFNSTHAPCHPCWVPVQKHLTLPPSVLVCVWGGGAHTSAYTISVHMHCGQYPPASPFPIIPSVMAGGGGQMTLARDLAHVARFILDHYSPTVWLSCFLDGHCHTGKYFLCVGFTHPLPFSQTRRVCNPQHVSRSVSFRAGAF